MRFSVTWLCSCVCTLRYRYAGRRHLFGRPCCCRRSSPPPRWCGAAFRLAHSTWAVGVSTLGPFAFFLRAGGVARWLVRGSPASTAGRPSGISAPRLCPRRVRPPPPRATRPKCANVEPRRRRQCQRSASAAVASAPRDLSASPSERKRRRRRQRATAARLQPQAQTRPQASDPPCPLTSSRRFAHLLPSLRHQHLPSRLISRLLSRHFRGRSDQV